MAAHRLEAGASNVEAELELLRIDPYSVMVIKIGSV